MLLHPLSLTLSLIPPSTTGSSFIALIFLEQQSEIVMKVAPGTIPMTMMMRAQRLEQPLATVHAGEGVGVEIGVWEVNVYESEVVFDEEVAPRPVG